MSAVEDLWREGWFLRVARSISGMAPEFDARDLALMAVPRAMRAEESWDGKGDVATWVKYCASNDMRHWWRRWAIERQRVSANSIYDTLPGGTTLLMDRVGVAANDTESEALANMRDIECMAREVRAAVAELAPAQRHYVTTKFFTDKPVIENGAHAGNWGYARQNLRVKLSHLKWMIR